MNSSNLLKLFEYVIQPVLENHLMLNNRQFGFRGDTGCTSALLILKEVIKKYVSENSSVFCAMIDVSKAFDKINYDVLKTKLMETSLPKHFVLIVDYMIRNTYVESFVNGLTSESWKMNNGTRQGGVNSPLIFSFYINQMITSVSELGVGCTLGGVRSNIICYADDICCLAPTQVALQSILDVVNEKLDEIKLHVNVKKCAVMLFGRNNANHIPVLRLNSEVIDHVTQYKYLGVILSDNSAINTDIDRVMNSFLKQYNSMYRKFYDMNGEVLQFLFRTYTSSFYGIELWYDSLCNRYMNKLCICYHKAVKRVARLQVWDSNHLACDIVKVRTFPHLLAKRTICLLFSIFKTRSPCLMPYKSYFVCNSSIVRELKKYFSDKYGIENIVNNPLCAIISRIEYVRIQQTNIAMLFAFAEGKFESFNKCVRLSLEEITGKGKFRIWLQKWKNNKF